MSPTAQIAHVLFLDIVGYSTESTSAQARMIDDLNRLVSASPTFSEARRSDAVLPLPTGDGMALLFRNDLVGPARCAMEISQSLAEKNEFRVRMGIHSGLVQSQTDIAGNANVAGEGINVAQRVMDLASAGQIYLSSQYAEWLKQFDDWAPRVQEVGELTTKHGVRLRVFRLHSEVSAPAIEEPPTATKERVVLLYKRKAQPDETLLDTLYDCLQEQGYQVFVDRHLKIGVEWAKAIEAEIRAADAVVVLVSDAAVGSEMIEYEVETAADENRRRGKPLLLPVRVGTDHPLEGPVGALLNALHFFVWNGPQDNNRLFSEIQSTITAPPKPAEQEITLEPVGGAVPLDSRFYVERPTDHEFSTALRAVESILLVKGPRQMGKTSLLGRGAKQARDLGFRVGMTDFQKLSSAQLADEERCYRLLAHTLGRQLGFTYDFESEWIDVFGPNMNMDNFIRALIESADTPLVWFMDEADKLFGAPFASDFFGLVRSWHNSRATEPFGPWSRFSVVIGYATEAHLFIQDLNQSPFNVGRQMPLQPFDLDQIHDLNVRHGSPLSSMDQVRQLEGLIGGQPFLVRRAFDVLARGMDFPTLMETADREDGPFGDHLKRILISVSQMPAVVEALKASLATPDIRDTDGYHRLLAAGIVHATRDNRVAFRCELYRRYLSVYLSG